MAHARVLSVWFTCAHH